MAEVSVGTHIGRRDVSRYHVVRLEDVQILVSQELASTLRHLYIDLKKFLFFRNLTATPTRKTTTLAPAAAPLA